eukprot:969048_1
MAQIREQRRKLQIKDKKVMRKTRRKRRRSKENERKQDQSNRGRGIGRMDGRQGIHPNRRSLKYTQLTVTRERNERMKETKKRWRKIQISRERKEAAKERRKERKQWRKKIKKRMPFIRTEKRIELSYCERLALSMHPKFIPYPKKPDLEHYGHVLRGFINSMRWRYLEAMRSYNRREKTPHQKQIEEEERIAAYLVKELGFPSLPYIKRKSKGISKTNNHVLEAALSFIETGILKEEKWVIDNMDKLSKQIYRGIAALRKRCKSGECTVIRGDKSNRFGLVDCASYVDETHTFLRKCNFEIIELDATAENVIELKRFKDQRVQSAFWTDYLEPLDPISDHYHPGKCYGLGKDHKQGSVMPMRGICSAIDTSIEKTSRRAAYYLRAVQMQSKNLIIDIQHFQHLLLLYNNDPRINWQRD